MCTDDSASSTTPAAAAAARPRRASAPGPFVVGLVGPAGAGKSTVAAAFARTGARVLNGDTLGHEVTDTDPDVRAALAADYGADVYRADGTLDRRRVAARVFADPAALARLNQLVHPRILARMRAAVAQAERDGFTGVLLIDAALLLDWGFERECDAIVAVLAPEERLVERLVATRGWSAAEARQRLSAARRADSFRALADVTVMNDGSAEQAADAALRAVADLRAARAGAA